MTKPVRIVDSPPTTGVPARPMTHRVTKRGLDIVASTVALTLSLPFMALIALAIKLDSRGPVFYGCQRIGYGGSQFQMLKFRKMWHGTKGPALTVGADERFTRVGRLLAVSKLDEMPQFWNVFRGEMSLVGPRPEDPSFVVEHPEAYQLITQVKPGITGLSQLAFAEESEILDREDPVRHYLERLLPQKTQMDRLYASRGTIGMDLRILAWTCVAVLVRKDVAVNRQTGKLTLRRRDRGSAAVTETARLDGADDQPVVVGAESSSIGNAA
jgi:lipopolysaccharide/colanic/teichoic acid biosynthesis glycosyltransferase